MTAADVVRFPFAPVPEPPTARITVLGVGGGGGHMVAAMAARPVAGVRYIAANTDDQALRHLAVPNTLSLGLTVTKGLGAGADPSVGRAAAVEDREAIQRALEGADMVFVTAGMGGGTGTGAAPLVAHVAKALDILTVAVVTRPFDFENRGRAADEGIADLRSQVDSLIVIPNEGTLDVPDAQDSIEAAFAIADAVARDAVEGVAEIVLRPGLINADFRDVRRVMAYGGATLLGRGRGRGPNRVRDAIDAAINNPVLDKVALGSARGVLVNVTAARQSVGEFREVGETISKLTSAHSEVILGLVVAPELDDPELGPELRVTVIATGFGHAVGTTRPAWLRRGPARSPPSQAGSLDVPSFLQA